MPTPLFFELNPEKRKSIMTAGISEFGNCGYENSSTNQIVKKAGISKGSLFKYFPTKEDLYFYVLDEITSELIAGLEEKADSLSTELFQRIIDYSVMEFSWYIQYPEKSKMIVKAFTKSDTDIYRKTILKYSNREHDICYWFLQDIDTSQLKWDKSKTIRLLMWFLKGFNEDFLNSISMQGDNNIEELEQKYVESLLEYIEILKSGLIR